VSKAREHFVLPPSCHSIYCFPCILSSSSLPLTSIPISMALTYLAFCLHYKFTHKLGQLSSIGPHIPLGHRCHCPAHLTRPLLYSKHQPSESTLISKILVGFHANLWPSFLQPLGVIFLWSFRLMIFLRLHPWSQGGTMITFMCHLG
jgi:hypothetical protein